MQSALLLTVLAMGAPPQGDDAARAILALQVAVEANKDAPCPKACPCGCNEGAACSCGKKPGKKPAIKVKSSGDCRPGKSSFAPTQVSARSAQNVIEFNQLMRSVEARQAAWGRSVPLDLYVRRPAWRAQPAPARGPPRMRAFGVRRGGC